jgi:hypothetical protein
MLKRIVLATIFIGALALMAAEKPGVRSDSTKQGLNPQAATDNTKKPQQVASDLAQQSPTEISDNCPGCEWVRFAQTANSDRDDELRKNCGPFRTVDARPQYSFNELCQKINKRCAKVCDWEGHTKACDEVSQKDAYGNPTRDGSRVAWCVP